MKLRILILAAVLHYLLLSAATTHAHNITRILAKHPEFSTFNHYLTTTHLAGQINRRRTITVCAVNNAAMNDILAKQFSIYTIKNILSLHIFTDYFGAKKLHQITKGSTTTSTLFQATGEATGNSGYVNITDTKGGKVGITPADSDSDRPVAIYVKSIQELPYNISVIQISNILSSPEAEAPAAAPTDLNLTSIMANQGCKGFSDLITTDGAAAAAFSQSIEQGLTIFCPSDDSLKSFMPRYKNLTAAGKTSLLLYHGVPEYKSLGMLRSGNGVKNTLATEKGKNYNFTVENDGDDVTIETGVVTAVIEGTLIDEDPLAVYKIDRVLLPRELFTAAPPGKTKSRAGEDADAPGPAEDDGIPADADSNNGGGGGRFGGDGGIVGLCFSLSLGVLFWIWF